MLKLPKPLINLGLIVAIVICLVGTWYIFYPWASWRYKITVSVDTPEGLKTGSAVREVHAREQPQFMEMPRLAVNVVGEAVAVDLGKRGVLFSLIDWNDYRFVYESFPSPSQSEVLDFKYYAHLKNVKAVVPLYRAPMLVRFQDLNDPKTVERVDPNNLANSFGRDVFLKDITIEMTNEPVTWSVAHYLGWLQGYYNKRLDGERYGTIDSSHKLANSLASGMFSTGKR